MLLLRSEDIQGATTSRYNELQTKFLPILKSFHPFELLNLESTEFSFKFHLDNEKT